LEEEQVVEDKAKFNEQFGIRHTRHHNPIESIIESRSLPVVYIVLPSF
jgi:hypothetical protein